MLKRVVVTGANGFVGRHLCRELVDRGWSVYGVDRLPPGEGVLPDEMEFCADDVLSSVGWARMLDGADTVVHLIAATHGAAKTTSEYAAVNVEGTRRVLEASVEAGVKRFVYLSSIKAVGEGGDLAYSEATPCCPEDAYGSTKRQAEIIVQELTANTSTTPIMLRPPALYGPGMKGNLLALLKLVDKATPLPLGCVRNARSMLYVGNLVSAITGTLECSDAVTGVFHVVDDGEPVSTRELAVRLSALLGRRPLIVPVPIFILKLCGMLVGRTDITDRLTRSLVVSGEAFKKALGWNPPTTLEEGLQRTVDWYRNERNLK